MTTETENIVRIVIVGAGAVGSYLGAKHAQAGDDVTLLCRGAHLRAVRERGLRLQEGNALTAVTRLRATDALPEGGPPADVVLLCVKRYDLASAAVAARPALGPHTMVVTIQNGVAAHEDLAKILDPKAIVAGAITATCTLPEPGRVDLQSESALLVFGEPHGALTPRVSAFERAGLAAGYTARASEHIVRELWTKFVLLNAVAPLSVLSRQPVGVLRGDAALRSLMVAAMREVIGLARRNHVELDPQLTDRMLERIDALDPASTVSMLQDLEAGKPLEIEWISGYVSREGKRLGLPTPIADLAHACMRPHAQGRNLFPFQETRRPT